MALVIVSLIALVAFAIVAWQSTRTGILLFVIALPTYLIRFHIGPAPTTLLELFFVVLTIVWIVRRPRWNHIHVPKRFTAATVLLLLAATIGVAVSPHHLAALGAWRAYFVEPIIFFLMIATTLSSADTNDVLVSLGVSGMIVSVFGIIQRLTNLGIPAPWDIEHRITSVYDFPNAVGLFLGPIVTIALLQFFRTLHASRFKTLFWFFVAGLGTTAIILAQTEAAYVAIPASLFIASLFVKKIRRFTIPLALVALVAGLSAPIVRQKLTLHDYSGEVRRTQWSETITMLKDHPQFGAGLEGYPTVFAPYHHADWVEIFQYPHNIILNIWSELGLLGLIAFFLLAYAILASLQTPRFHDSMTLLIPFVALLEMTIHGLVDVPYFKNDLAFLTWTLFAFIVVAQRQDQTS